ncbi:MAG: two-component regulator propeller domain-containing protein [Bacteroidota bacterium]|nr:two-component regulator propeller domain-containing protein [Bacteroidota bacterium]
MPKLNVNASVGIFEFGEDQNMPSSVVTHMMEDSQGMIWMATEKGICRFDGEYIDTYDILDERFTGAQTAVLSILEDENGRIWVYTADMGLYVIDPQVGIVRNAFLAEDRLRFNLGNTMIMDSKGMIWFGTIDGIFIVDPNEFSSKHFPQRRDGDNVRQMVEDGFGKIWIGSDTGLSVIDMESGQVQAPGNLPNFYFSSVNGLFCDSQNNIWVSTEEEGTAKIHSSRERSQVLGSAQGVRAPVSQFTEGKHGKIWMSSYGGGIYIFDPVTQRLKHLNKVKGLIDDRVNLSFLDSQGQIWIATAKGLNLLDTEGLMPNFLTEEDGLSWPNVWSFMEDREGDLWLGAWESMDLYNPKSNSIKRVDLALQLEKTVSISFEPLRMPSGNYLIKAPSLGLAIFNPDRSTIMKVTPENGLTNLQQSSCFVDRSGKIWTGSFRNGAIEVFDPKTNAFKRLTNKDGMMGDFVWGIHEDMLGQIWAGTDLGVNIINIEENTISYLMEGESTTARNFGAFLTDKENRLWMGTRTGILVADQKNSLLTSISPENGLISKAVYTLYQYDGVIYAGTGNGLSTFTPPASFSTDTSVLDIKSYAKEQGFIFNDFNADAAIAYNDKLWWGIETEALTVTDTPKKDTLPGTTYISGVAISDQSRNFYDYELARQSYTDLDTLFGAQKDTFYLADQRPKETGWLKENDIQWDGLEGSYNLPVNLKIPFEQNYVSFQFTGTQLKNRNKTRYSYYLDGFDEAWSDLSAEPYSKNYRNLPAGNYTFNVRSQTFDGVWSQPATFNFTILPHWTNTWWAWLLYIFTFLIVVSAIVQYRARALKKENAILEEKVNHRTAQLKKSVEDLKSTQSQLIHAEKMASLGELTAGIAHEIKNPLNFVNNFSEVSSELIDEALEHLTLVKTRHALSPSSAPSLSPASSPDHETLDDIKDILSDIRQNLNKIHEHGTRADGIVKSMLMHSRGSSGKKVSVDFNNLIKENVNLTFHSMRANKNPINAEIIFNLDEKLEEVPLITEDFSRVILNLCSNAFDAMRQKSLNSKDYKPVLSIITKKLDQKAVLEIHDNGPGIPDDIKTKIFQPFFTTKQTGQGTGLGLSLSYDIITKGHGGNLEVESKAGVGTTFIIHLPNIEK